MWTFVCCFIWGGAAGEGMPWVDTTRAASVKEDAILGKATNQILPSLPWQSIDFQLHTLMIEAERGEGGGVDFGWTCTKSTWHERQVSTKFPTAIHNSLDTICGLHSECATHCIKLRAHVTLITPERPLSKLLTILCPLFPSLRSTCMHPIGMYLIPRVRLKYSQCPFSTWTAPFVNHFWNEVSFWGKYKCLNNLSSSTSFDLSGWCMNFGTSANIMF